MLPGGDIAGGDLPAFEAGLRRQYPFLAPALARRLAASYGTRALRILDGIDSAAALGLTPETSFEDIVRQYIADCRMTSPQALKGLAA